MSELDALRHSILGSKFVDARVAEQAVIETCDTAVELRQKRLELAVAEREVSRLLGRRRSAKAARADGREGLGTADDEAKPDGGAAGGSSSSCAAPEPRADAEEEEEKVEQELQAALLRQRVLKEAVQELEETSALQPELRKGMAAVLPDATGSSGGCGGSSSSTAPPESAGSSSSSSSSQAQGWGRLLSRGQGAAPLVVDEEDEEDEDHEDGNIEAEEPGPFEAATALAGWRGFAFEDAEEDLPPDEAASQRAESLPASQAGRPRLPLRETPARSMSDREWLNRFKSTEPEQAAASQREPAKPLVTSKQVPSLTRRASLKQHRPQVPPQSEAKRPRPEEKPRPDGQLTAPHVKDELSEEKKASKELACLPESKAPMQGKGYSIDVNQLVPKELQNVNSWKEANPSEWRAQQSQGEIVNPRRNLMKQPFTSKRRSDAGLEEEGEPTPKKTRRDDTNDAAYARRQKKWEKNAADHLPPALSLKQEVDAMGQAKAESSSVCKEEDPGHAKLDLSLAKFEAGLQDDIQVAEGLRCPRWLWQALYPYQHECCRWLCGLHTEGMGGILADEMGLGKTIQIIAYLAVLHHSGVLQKMRIQNTSLGTAMPAQTGGVLITCPATLIEQWKSELNLWYPPLRVCIMHQTNKREREEAIQTTMSHHGVLITSYETLRIAHEELLEATWVIMVLDEGQKIRNPHAGVTLAVKRFSTPHRIILSGSPVQNNLKELWSLFDFICPGRLGTLPVFLEEFAAPIEKGNFSGANAAVVAAAYQCALALRQLTQPCILRRTKDECMDVLKLPHKQEQVLFCHLSPEQYQVYVDFLQTEQVRRAMQSSNDRKSIGAVFFAISVLRKLCNHPDLLLRDADASVRPSDMWNLERSGKMKALVEIMKLWHSEGHRALVFVQTVQMLEVIEHWMNEVGYTHLRIDGKTAVKKRLKLIDQFNADASIFAMILTTRVGGVGLNIVGADRVVIFDPDWNPMTDVQARERTWRIGQLRDVIVYRLILSGSLEEKIYQRQVYKHFLSHKVLNDPRQRNFFKWNDLADLFDVPPAPPDFDPRAMQQLKAKYKSLFGKLKADAGAVKEVETTEVMQAISNLPTSNSTKASKEASQEHSAMLQTLYDKSGIKASFNHDKVEQPLLDRKIVRESAGAIASRALQAVKNSARERAAHHISEPTWTGKAGRAGARGGALALAKREGGVTVKREQTFNTATAVGMVRGAVSSADILAGLRQLSRIRAAQQERNVTQSEEAANLRLRQDLANGAQGSAVKREPDAPPQMPAIEDEAAAPLELHESDRKIAELILRGFLDKNLAGKEHRLTTGQVLEHLATSVAPHHSDLFKALLKQMCQLSKPQRSGEPGVWTLRPEFAQRRH